MDRIKLFKKFYVNSSNHKDVDPNVWMLNYIIDRMEMNQQQVLWLCFLNAVTYHAPTALVIWNELAVQCSTRAALDSRGVSISSPLQTAARPSLG